MQFLPHRKLYGLSQLMLLSKMIAVHCQVHTVTVWAHCRHWTLGLVVRVVNIVH
jgi:hypothetical protein